MVVRAGVVRFVIGAAVVGAIVALGAVWYVRGPGPLAFTGGKSVALADYKGGDATGVPLRRLPIDRALIAGKKA